MDTVAAASSLAPKSVTPLQDCKPHTLVLQPSVCLDEISSSLFQVALARALMQASKAVIVDLIWVERVTSDGLNALKIGIKIANDLGKELSFLSADSATYAALALERDRHRSLTMSDHAEICSPSLNEFLGRRGRPLPSASTLSSLLTPKPFVKSTKPVPTSLPVEPYTQTSWQGALAS